MQRPHREKAHHRIVYQNGGGHTRSVGAERQGRGNVRNKDVRKHGDYLPERQVGPDSLFAPPLIEVRHDECGDGQYGKCGSKHSGSRVNRKFLSMPNPLIREPDCFFGVV